MPKIEFRGKTYNSEFEMPLEERRAYKEEQERRAKRENTGTKSLLTDLVDMAPEVREIYERALGNVEEKFQPSRTPDELPKTEDLYRQSAPRGMEHLPSDESIYQPSQPAIDPMKSTIEPESGVRRLISSILWALAFAAVVFLAMQFIP